LQAKKVRLVADDWLDFELKIAGKVISFEAVEADDPNRRRGKEYPDDADPAEAIEDPIEDWIWRAGQIPSWLDAACKKKAGKSYSARTNLIIYLSNAGEYGIRQDQVEACFPSATGSAKNHFNSIWVIWKMKPYLVWRDGQRMI